MLGCLGWPVVESWGCVRGAPWGFVGRVVDSMFWDDDETCGCYGIKLIGRGDGVCLGVVSFPLEAAWRLCHSSDVGVDVSNFHRDATTLLL